MPRRGRTSARKNTRRHDTAEPDDDDSFDFGLFQMMFMMAAIQRDLEGSSESDNMQRLLHQAEIARERWILNVSSLPKRLTGWQLHGRTRILLEDATMAEDMEQMDKSNMLHYSQIALGLPTHCSTTEWDRLEAVGISQLECPRYHGGKVLIGRILTSPARGAGVTFAVEDPAGLAIHVTIMHPTNGPTRLTPKETFDAIYPVGGVIAIREPDVRFVQNGGVGIRVEIPSDVVRVHASDKRIRTLTWKFASPTQDARKAIDLKESGNRYMAKGQYWLAVHEYTYALAFPEDQLDSLLLYTLYANRAMANLKSERPGAAYRDCLQAETLGSEISTSADQKKKIAWRKAAAAYAMRVWQHAHDLARVAVDLGVDSATTLVKSSASRLREQTGQFDWEAIFKSYGAKQKLDLADYNGPIEVRDSPGRGRGVFLTADVRAGDLLLVEKALVHAGKEDLGSVFYTQINFATNHADSGTHVVAGQKAVHQLMDNTGLQPVWNSLCGVGKRSESTPFVSEAERLKGLHSIPDIDVMLLEDVFTANAYGLPELTANLDQISACDKEEKRCTTLWALTSIFNHSCLPNISLQRWGEFAVVRARSDMLAGTELFSCYFPADLTLADRRDRSQKWKFVCDCKLCIDDVCDNQQVREHLIKEVLPKVVSQSNSVLRRANPSLIWKAEKRDALQAAEALLANIEVTSAPDRSINPHLFPLYRVLSDHYSHSDLRKAIKADIKSLECAGAVMASSYQRKEHGRTIHELGSTQDCVLVRSMINLAELHKENSDRAEATAWLKTACWAHQVLVGGGPALFHMRYKQAMPKGIAYK